jgi:N12 class adenine-specific DNA methylase
MANGNGDPVLDEIGKLGGGGVAVAEPEDPVLSEISKLGKPPAAPKEDLTEAARVLKTPLPSLSDQASRLGELPLELPPSSLQPHAVRGQFGQPIPPLPVEEKLESERYKETTDKGIGEPEKEQEQSREDAMGALGRIGKASEESVLEGAKQVAQMRNKPTPDTIMDAMKTAAPMVQTPHLALDAAIPSDATGVQANLERGLLKGVGELTTPENLALAGGMEALPATFATSAAGKVILGTGFTVPMAVQLAQTYPEVREAIAHENWDQVALLAGQAIPTAVFTAEGVRNIYEGITQGVNITKQFMRARDEFSRRQAEATTKLPETTEKPPAEASAASPEPEPEPEAPAAPEKEEAPPEKPRKSKARKVAPPEAPPEEKTAVALENAAQEIRESTAPAEPVTPVEEPGLPMEPEREVMRQPPSTSRGTPTGEEAALPAELKADLEEQAGRPLTDEEAVAMDRSNLERGMAEHGPGDTLTIREEKRAELEQPGRPGELPTEPESKFGLGEEISPEQEPQPQEDETLAEIKSVGEKTEQLKTGEESPFVSRGFRTSETSPSIDRWNKMPASERQARLIGLGFSSSIAGKPWDELQQKVQKKLSDSFQRESGTLPTEEEVPADEQPTEPGERIEQQSVGGASESPLEEIPPEDARGTGEERGTAPESGGSGGADAERLAGRDQQSRSGPPERVGGGEGEVSVPAARTRQPAQHITGSRAGHDYRITERDHLGSGGERTKYRANISAIRTLKQLESEGRLATPEEQQTLVKYTGWGGIASNQLFNSDTKGGKNWSDEYEELRGLLSDDEYKRARASTVNAHYTSAPVVGAIWDALRHLGFREGAMLEPSAGIGHFLGLEPGDLADATRRSAVELDPVSGRILKQLYQSADVRIQSFGDFRVPNDTYDIAVGNVPFGKIIVNDPGYNKHKLSIHNYFILKTLDKLRPGGVAALITSAHTLDSQEKKQRELFANRADLIGAIRLPNNAFKGNAGTEVTTDILFFRKREPGEKYAGEPFQDRQEITSGEGHQIPINEYFAKHPEMMLGNMELAGTMRRAGEPALIARPDEDLKEALTRAVAKLPEGAFVPRQAPDGLTTEASADAIPDYKEVKPYGLTVKNGKVYRRIGDAIQHEPDFPKKQIQTLKEMLGVRDVARELLQAEAKDRSTKELADLRRRLNNSYDKFRQKNGIIHSPKNERAMHADPDLPLLLSLEDYDKDTKTANKAAIFRQRVVNPTPTVTAADNAKDAMMVSLGEKGRLDFDRMAELTGKPAAELQADLKAQGLVFEDPSGHWETADRYLSGNVRKKLAAAEAAAQEDDKFRPNVEALQAVIPETVSPSKIFMKLGSPWIPDHVMKDFVGHILGLQSVRDVKLYHDDIGATYDLTVPYGVDPVLNRTRWGTARASAEWLLQQGLNLKAPTIYDPLPDNKRVVNPKETAAAEQKLNDLHAELKRWVFEDSPHGDEVSHIFNEKLNANVDWQPDGSHLTFPGMNPEIQLRPYQKNAVWRAVSGSTNTLLAHEVGLGKTYIMGAVAAEWRRLGLKKKPLIVFPTHLVPQNSGDLMRLYPGANYLIADEDSFDTMNRKEFLNRIVTGDWDAVIIGDSQFGKMPPGQAIATETTQAMLDEARDKYEEAKDNGDRETVKVVETQIANFEAQLERYQAQEKKDDVIPFNETGVDGLIVDEAHRLKSLPFPTKMGRVRGIPQTKSQRSLDSYIKAQYVTRINNGNGVVFATGTPVTNTIAEAWIMMKFLDEDNLRSLGMQNFDAWAATFGQSETKAEGSPEDPSKLRMITRFSKFDNLAQLAQMFRRTADVKFADDKGIELSRPGMVGGKMQARETEPSPALLNFIESLVSRAALVRGKKPGKGEDNMLVITGDGRKAALDMRMVDASAEDDPDSKLNQAAQDIANLYHDSRDRKTTQLVGMDFREGEGGFDSYEDLRKKLMGLGIPKNEIAFMQDYKTAAKKQKLFAQVNKGDIAVVIGHSDTLGVGVNVQRKLGAIHILAPPYRPDQVEQVIGRGIRWGNENKEVVVRNHVTKRSYDVYLWDVLTRKAEFIKSLLKGETDIGDIGDLSKTSMNYAEMKAAASGDQRLFRKIELESTLHRLEMVHSAYRDQQFDNRAKIAQLPERIDTTRKLLDATRADRTTWDARPEKFQMTVGKKVYSDRKEAGAALNSALQSTYDKGMRLGEYAGFQIYSGTPETTGRTGYLRGARSWDFKMGQGEPNEKGDIEASPAGTIQSIETIGRKIVNAEQDFHERIPRLTQELEDRREQLQKPFDKQKELDKAHGELDKLNTELGFKNAIDQNQDDGDDGQDEPQESPDDLTQSFLGLQNIYNRISQAIRRMRARNAAVSAGGGGAGVPPRRPEEGLPMEPEEPRRGAEPGEKAINIRLDKLNTSDEVLDLIRNVAKTHTARIQAQRRGRLSDAQLKQRMGEVGLDPEKLAKLKKGTALNEAEMQVAIGIMLDKGEQVREAAHRAAEANSTENLLELQRLENEYVAIQAAVSGAKAESGRALRIQRMVSEAFRSQNKGNYERVLDALGGRGLTEKQREKLLQIPEDDKVALARFLRDTAKFTTPQKVVAYWVNNILSSPRTIQRKLLGDAAMAALAVPERFVRGALDPAIARMQGRPREFFARDALAQTLAYLKSIPAGVRAGSFIVANGFDLQDATELDMPFRYELPGGLAMNWPTRLLAGATAMFKTMHFKSALAGLAMRTAIKEGLKGDAIGERATELVNDPLPGMINQAWDEARTLSLVEQPDRTLRSLLSFRENFLKIPEDVPLVGGLAPMRFVVPFATIGWNIAKNAFRYSPAGVARLGRKEVREGPEASNVLAQALVGSLIMAAIAAWAADGNITAGAPKSAQDRDAFFRSGKQPYSLKIGNHWVRYTAGWGPVALMIAAVGGWYDSFKDGGQQPNSDKIQEVAAGLGNAITDQTFFRGIQNLDQAVSDPKRYGQQFLTEIASGMIPFSGFDRTWAEALDPEIREPQGFAERIKSGLPIFSRDVPPRLDALGRPSIRRGGTGGEAFLPAPIPEDVPESNIDSELARLHDLGLRNPGFTGRFLTVQNTKIPMSRQEQNEYLGMRGNVLRGVLDEMFKSPDYQALNDQDKISEVQEAIRDVDNFARGEMISRLIERRLGPEQGQQQPQAGTLPMGAPVVQ